MNSASFSSFVPRPTAWLLALALGSTTVSALAQAGSPPPGGRQAQERTSSWQGRHLQELKARLQLTPAQEAAWATYVAALQMRPAHAAQHAQQHQELAQLSTPERIARMKSLRAQHQADMVTFMDRRADATLSFYGALTPEQQKTFDAETARRMQERGHRGRGHEHPHGGPMHHGRG